MGQAVLIKINSQDCSSLWQGHTSPSRENEKWEEVGLHGWMQANREICKKVRCHYILINPHLGGLVRQKSIAVLFQAMVETYWCHIDVWFVLPSTLETQVVMEF